MSLGTELVDGVLRLTLDRPAKLNAINHDLRARLHRALTLDAAAPEVRVVLLTGAGRAFSAGGDVTEMATSTADTMAKLEAGRVIVEAMARLPKPVVAGVRGHAAGAGFSLALAADLVVADTTAVFRSVFVHRGLVPDMGATYWLARQVGLHRAKEIMLTGRPVGAREAHDLGIVTRLFGPDEFAAGLDGVAADLAQGPTVAYGATKRLLNVAFEHDLGAQLDAEALSQVMATTTQDHAESVAAFLAKCSPTFRGR
jgi:2-(1,2-epoxy-1,2-dihydrophenyl)acetyl-CoA isomerase